MLTRKVNWPRDLHVYLIEGQTKEFQYGAWDCALFVTQAVGVMTGLDLHAPFTGKYATRKEAYRALRDYCGKASLRAVVEKISREHEMPEVAPMKAQRGDVVLIRRGLRDFSLGLVDLNGQQIVVLRKSGLGRMALSEAYRCWRV